MASTPAECRVEILRLGWTARESGHDSRWTVYAEHGKTSLVCHGNSREEAWQLALHRAQVNERPGA